MSDRIKNSHKSGPTDSRESLLAAAQSVFADKGFEGATVKDLADEAGVNVSLVSYHFGGKEGLYRACLESFGFERVEAAERILQAPNSSDELKLRLTLFAEDFIAIHMREPNTCKIIHRGLDLRDAITADLFKSVFLRIFLALNNFVLAAQDNRLIKEHLDAEIVSSLLFGSLMHNMRATEIRKQLGKPTFENAEFTRSFIRHWLESHCDGMLTRSP